MGCEALTFCIMFDISKDVQAFLTDLYRYGPAAWDRPSDMPTGLVWYDDGWYFLTQEGRELAETIVANEVCDSML